MKDNQVKVTGTSEIDAAVELAERYAVSAANDSGAQICPLVCEELLLRLLNTGCPEISVSAKKFPRGYLEITAAGVPAAPVFRSSAG